MLLAPAAEVGEGEYAMLATEKESTQLWRLESSDAEYLSAEIRECSAQHEKMNSAA
jgi:hypothetical protein